VTDVVLGGNHYDVYGTLADADKYLSARLGADAWTAASGNDKLRGMIGAANWIDRTVWAGTQTSDSQPLEFPRIGLVDKNDKPISPSVIPNDVIRASYELALALLNDPDAGNLADPAGNQPSSLGAGSVNVSFWRPQPMARFPAVAQGLLLPFVGSGAASPEGTGLTDADGNPMSSDFEGADEYGFTEGLK
jgi:hypothetical protein